MSSTHTSLSYHVVFSTRGREPFLVSSYRERLYQVLGGALRSGGGVAREIGGTSDHVHLLAGLRPTHTVADVIRDIKRATTAWMHETMRMRAFAWQEGYGAFTVSPYDCEELVRYIRGQEEHHRRRSFQEEYVEFLERHGIEFKKEYLW